MIPLTQGKVAIVDDEDFERLNKFNWYAKPHRNTFYAARKTPRVFGKQKEIRMHREVMSALPGVDVDHRNGDGLDNQKDNLRFASNQQNQQNERKRVGTSSRFKGVSWISRDCCWRARIKFNGRDKALGDFDCEEKAALAYDTAAKKYFGEFARPNFK